MEREYIQTIHEKEIAFFGKITASISHELNNVISIINEYSGLLEDLIYAGEQGKEIDKEKIQKIAQNIGLQIKREKKIVKLLNRFSHRVDNPVVNFDLNELVGDIFLISQRFANLKKVNLEYTPSEESNYITNSPFRLLLAVFSIIKLALDLCQPENTITIKTPRKGQLKKIFITTPILSESKETNEKMQFIHSLVGDLNGELKISLPNNQNQIFEIFLNDSLMD